MPEPENFMRCEINMAYLPLSDTDREGVAGTLENYAWLLLARANELRKGEPCESVLVIPWQS